MAVTLVFVELIGFIWSDDGFVGVLLVLVLARTAVRRLCCNGWFNNWDWLEVFVEGNGIIWELLVLLLLLLLFDDEGDDGSCIGINVYLFWRSLLLLLLFNLGQAKESSFVDEFVGVFSFSTKLWWGDVESFDRSVFGVLLLL